MQKFFSSPRTLNDLYAIGGQLLSASPEQRFVYGLHIFHPADAVPFAEIKKMPGRLLAAPAPAKVVSFADAMSDHAIAPFVLDALDDALAPADHVTGRHFAGLSSFSVVVMPEGARCESPIKVATEGGGNVTVVVIARRGSTLEIAEEVDVSETSPSLTIHLILDEGASVTYRAATNIGAGKGSFARRTARLASRASIEWIENVTSNGFAFLRTRSMLQGEGSCVRHKASVFAASAGNVDLNADAVHSVSRTESSFQARTVLAGDAHAIVRGLAVIAPKTSGCSARQKNDTLMFSKKSRVDAIPNLEIGTGEVTATHAASVAPVDPERLFYLMSRGLTRRAAEVLVTRAFFADVLGNDDDPVTRTFFARVDARFPNV